MEFLELPDEVIIHMYTFIDCNDIGHLCMVNKKLETIGNSDYLWQSFFNGLPDIISIPSKNIKSYINTHVIKTIDELTNKIISEIKTVDSYNISFIFLYHPEYKFRFKSNLYNSLEHNIIKQYIITKNFNMTEYILCQPLDPIGDGFYCEYDICVTKQFCNWMSLHELLEQVHKHLYVIKSKTEPH